MRVEAPTRVDLARVSVALFRTASTAGAQGVALNLGSVSSRNSVLRSTIRPLLKVIPDIRIGGSDVGTRCKAVLSICVGNGDLDIYEGSRRLPILGVDGASSGVRFEAAARPKPCSDAPDFLWCSPSSSRELDGMRGSDRCRSWPSTGNGKQTLRSYARLRQRAKKLVMRDTGANRWGRAHSGTSWLALRGIQLSQASARRVACDRGSACKRSRSPIPPSASQRMALSGAYPSNTSRRCCLRRATAAADLGGSARRRRGVRGSLRGRDEKLPESNRRREVAARGLPACRQERPEYRPHVLTCHFSPLLAAFSRPCPFPGGPTVPA